MFSASIKPHSVNHSQLILQISESMCSMNLVGVYLQYLTLWYLPPLLNLESACRETNKRNQKQREREKMSRAGSSVFMRNLFLKIWQVAASSLLLSSSSTSLEKSLQTSSRVPPSSTSRRSDAAARPPLRRRRCCSRTTAHADCPMLETSRRASRH